MDDDLDDDYFDKQREKVIKQLEKMKKEDDERFEQMREILEKKQLLPNKEDNE